MNASAHRANAREALRGHWLPAVIVGVIGTLFAAPSSDSVNFNFNFESGRITANVNTGLYAQVPEILNVFLHDWLGLMPGTVILISLILSIVCLLIGGAVLLGVCRYNLNLIDRKQAMLDDVLAGVPRFKSALAMCFLHWVLTTLPLLVLGFGQSLLQALGIANIPLIVLTIVLIFVFSIWNIVLTYGFAMAPYILLEDTACTGWQSLKRSWTMMQDHKIELFCLEFSFIGWVILCVFTLGIGILFVNPYMNAAKASFYRNLQNIGYSPVAGPEL